MFLHGWGLNRCVFDDLIGLLAPRYGALALDLPGYGETSACDPYTLDRLAAVVAASAPERCVVAGWSLGAQVAVSWARSAPRQVERLVLLGATPCFVQREDWKPAVDPKVFETFMDGVGRDRRATLERFISLQAHGDLHSKRVIRGLRASLAAHALPEVDVLEQGLRVLLQSDMRALLPGITQPALVIHGEHDQLAPIAAARALAQALPGARLAVVPGAAHAPFVSDPERVGRSLVEFFDER